MSSKTYQCRSCAQSHPLYTQWQLPTATELTSSVQLKKEIKHVSGSAGSPMNSVFVDGDDYRRAYTLTAGSGSLEFDPSRNLGSQHAIVFYGAATESIREEYGVLTGFMDAFKIVLPEHPEGIHLNGTSSLELADAVCEKCGSRLF